MFSRGFGSRGTPRTFADCERVWNDKAVAVKRHGRVKLGEQTYLHKGDGHYYATFHDNTIVHYYPEYKTIHGCGWEGSPTTQMRIAALAGVSMHSNSRLGYKEPVRVNGYPYFDGMRIDNYGHVLAEDQRPDYKEVVKKAVVQKYATLFRKIEKMTRVRWALGEWDARGRCGIGTFQFHMLLLRIERSIAAGDTFLDADDLNGLFGGVPSTATHKECIAVLREALRHPYYCANNGFETIEVEKNG